MQRSPWLATLVFALVLLVAAPAAAGAAFADVPSGNWAYGAVQEVAARGWMKGVAPGMFAPEAPLTRAEFAAALDRYAQVTPGGPGPRFTDVPSRSWFAPFVEAAAAHGLLAGVSLRRFDPGASVTRAQAAVAVVRLLGLDHVAADLPALAGLPAWAGGAGRVADDLGILTGTPAGFEPDAPLTRAQAAVVLDRLRGLPAARVAGEAARAAASVHVLPAQEDLNVGQGATFHAYVHDAAGYIIPAGFDWSGVAPDGTFTANAPGTYTVTARVYGGGPAGRAQVVVHRPAALAVEALPAAALAGATLPVVVDVLDSTGALDPADSGRPVHLAYGGRAWTATDRAGVAKFSLPVGASGVVTATADGLREGTVPLRSVSVPAPGPVLASGAGATVTAGVPFHLEARLTGAAVGSFPVHVSVSGPLAVQSAAGRISGSGPGVLATLVGTDAGQGSVTVTAVGGAVAPATLDVRVAAAGTVAWRTGTATVTAGAPATLAFTVPAGTAAAAVSVEPRDPAGHLWPDLQPTVQGQTGSVTVRPTRAGIWHYRLVAPGYTAGSDAAVTVRPGPVARLVADPVPTSILLPGQTARLTAWLGDAYGNVVEPVVPEARLDAGPGQLQGPSPAHGPADPTFTAAAPGLARVSLSDPADPALAPVHVTFRVVARPADILAGKGLWLLWADWRDNPQRTLIRQAVADGVTHFYLEVATSHDGFYGGRGLDTFLRACHDAGIALVDWVYPVLADPQRDIALAREVAAYATPTGDRADGLAADIEEQLGPQAVGAYARAVRQAVGPRGLFAAVTYPPQFKPDYPFQALVPYVDAFVPMDYWHIYERDYTYAQAYAFVRTSIERIRSLAGRPGVPVSVDAEAYDQFADSGRGIFSPSALEMEGAMQAAADAGAVGVSFYRWGSATKAEWAVIGQAWP